MWWPGAVYPDPKECNFFETFGVGLLHVDPDHVWVNPGDSGGGQTECDVETRAELFWEAQEGRIVYQGRDMHIMSAVNLSINGKHVRRSPDRLARTAGIPAVTGGPEPTIGPAQLWKGCPFVAILNLPGQPAHSAPFLLGACLCTHWGADCHRPPPSGARNGRGVRDRDAAKICLRGGGWDGGMGRGGGETDAGGICCL